MLCLPICGIVEASARNYNRYLLPCFYPCVVMVHDKVRLPFVPAAGILKRLNKCQLTSSLGPKARAPPAPGVSVLPTYAAPISSAGLP